jgi:nucleotide-binding universal stress UspA family protein
LTPIVVVLVILYFGAILGLLWWAVAAQPDPELPPSRTKRSEPNRNAIIVPLTESPTSRWAVELACQIASERGAAIILAHVIEIPLAFGQDVPLAVAVDNGKFILEIGERMVKQHDLPVESRLLLNQTTAQALLQLERETGAEVIVVGAGSAPRWSFTHMERTATELLRCAPCQVVVARAPLSTWGSISKS